MSTNTNSDGQNTAALTPISDFVFNFRNDLILWGRHGNDVLLGFDPAAPTPAAPAPGTASPEDFDWNILLGDFLDENILGSRRFFARPDETGINGEDRFILGDWRQPYYLDDYVAGSQRAAVVADFQPELDTIQLHGSREDYILFRYPITFPPASEDDEPQTFRGKVLVYVGSDPETNTQDFDLIAFFPNVPPRSTDTSLIGGIPLPDFDLDGDYFKFVGDAPPPGPTEPNIRQFGTIGVELGTGVSVDPFGNAYVTGVTTGILGESNQGSYDVWVAKYDTAGNQQWLKQYGTTHPDIVWDIETFLTEDGEVNFYLTGSTTGVISDALGGAEENEGYQDIWLARFDSGGDPVLDSEGNPVFVRQNPQELTRVNPIAPLGSEIDNSLQIDVDSDGNLYQSGVTVEQAEVETNNGLQDFAWVASYDPEGNQRWINDDSLDSAEGFGFDESYGVALSADGTTYATGFTQLNIAGPDRLIGVYDAWISRFDENGEQLFIEQFGSINYDFAWGVDTDSENNAYIVGATAGDLLGPDGNPVATNAGFYDIFLAKFSQDGTYEWAVQFGTEGDDAQYLGDIVIDAFDNIFITGFTNSNLGGPNQGGYDTWVASYDTTGQRNWITQFGSTEQDNPTSLDVDNQGSIYVTGSTEGSLGVLNQGSSDAWIAKLNAETGALQNFGLPKPPNVIKGTPGDDTLYGTDGDDKIKALAGNDIVYGAGGNDLIKGGKGRDTLYGGQDDDTIKGGQGNDLIYGADGHNHLSGGKGRDTLYGGQNDDKIAGNQNKDLIYGSGGNDDLSGNGGNDTLYGGQGNDTVTGGYGNDLIYGADGHNHLSGGKGRDTLYGGQDDDTIKGGQGKDLIYGSGGHDCLSGGKGRDTLYGGSGNDKISGNEGDDFIYSGKGNNYVNGGKGNDTIYGNRGNDTIFGGAGDDLAYGAEGDDLFIGGQGYDQFYGGSGRDTFALGDDRGSFYTFKGSKDFALIKGFNLHEDSIQLHGSASDYTLKKNVGHLPSGTAIFQKEGNELIGVIAYQHVGFDGSGFEFLG